MEKTGAGANFSTYEFSPLLFDPLPVHWWLLEHFAQDANQPKAALTADPGGPGIPNLLAYAFALDPRSPARAGLRQVEWTGGLEP